MHYIIKNKCYDLILKDLEYLGEGDESNVYKLNDMALKIYKPTCRKKQITEVECNYMKGIETNRILLPTGTITNIDQETLGITTNYISNEKDKEEILEIPTYKLVSEMNLLIKDAEELGKRNISIDDITIDNTIYNGNLYIVDPGSFMVDYKNIRRRLSTAVKENMNIYMISDYFIYGLLKDIVKNEYDNEIAEDLTSYIAKDFAYSSSITCSDYFSKKLKPYDNYNEFVKKYIKKRNNE